MRTKLTITVDYELCKNFKKLSELTRIPASRLFDEAAEDLLNKHNFTELLKISEKNSKE